MHCIMAFICMEQDLRASLKALLQDQNLPADLCEAALEQFLDEFTKTRDILKASWHIAARLEQPFNRGPVPPISSKYVRVAKFVPLNDFIIHHLTLPRFGFSPSSDIFRIGRKMLDDEYVLNSLCQRSREDLIRTRNGVNWTTLDSEVTKPDPQILFDELGWNYLEPTEIVRISYDIATRHLHVPTVLDAQMVPWF